MNVIKVAALGALLAGASLAMPEKAMAFATLPACSVPGNLIQNCGFETGDATDWNTTNYNVNGDGNTTVDTSGPHTGNFALDLGNNLGMGDGTAIISQSFLDVAGDNLSVSFWLEKISGQAETTPDNSFQASIAGVTDPVLLSLTNVPGFDYTQYTFNYTATGADTLSFSGFDNFGNFELDDVVVLDTGVATTPEPTSIAVLGAGLAGLGMFRRRRK